MSYPRFGSAGTTLSIPSGELAGAVPSRVGGSSSTLSGR